jgi:hypothetical protein
MVCIKAAEGGHLEVLKYAHENGLVFDQREMSGQELRSEATM